MRGLCLMASLPPEGMALVGPRAAMTDPVVWLEAFLGSMARAKAPVVTAAHQMFFAEGVPPERISRYAAAMGPESPRALAEAHLAGAIASAATIRLPVLVLGGIGDRLVWRSCVMRTAFYHAAHYAFLGDVGHFMMLDPGAETVARSLREWLDAFQL
jgi:alpha-beta hydrolase superfamily lysophospholipase